MIPISPRPGRKERRRQRRYDAALWRRYWSRPYPSCYICDIRTGPFHMIVFSDQGGGNARPLPLVCPACFEELKKERPELGDAMPLAGIRFEEAAPK